MARFQIGDVITFTYPAVHLEGTKAHDKYPHVLVLHPNWKGLVHGLNLNYLSPHEINTIRMLIDPFYEMQYRDALRKVAPKQYDELESILGAPVPSGENVAVGSMYSRVKITTPRGFYMNVVRPFIFARKWDPYRKYRPDKMRAVRIVTPASVMMGEQSIDKWKREREAIAKELDKTLKTEVVTPDQQAKAEKLKEELEVAKGMSQRQSILKKFSNIFRFMRGPRM